MYKMRLKEAGSDSLGKNKQRGGLISVFSCLIDEYGRIESESSQSAQ